MLSIEHYERLKGAAWERLSATMDAMGQEASANGLTEAQLDALLTKADIEAFVPSAAQQEERGRWNQEYLARILRILQQEQEALERPDEPTPEPAGKGLLCDVLYISLDPYLRGRLSGRHISGPIAPGEPMPGASYMPGPGFILLPSLNLEKRNRSRSCTAALPKTMSAIVLPVDGPMPKPCPLKPVAT